MVTHGEVRGDDGAGRGVPQPDLQTGASPDGAQVPVHNGVLGLVGRVRKQVHLLLNENPGETRLQPGVGVSLLHVAGGRGVDGHQVTLLEHTSLRNPEPTLVTRTKVLVGPTETEVLPVVAHITYPS